MGIEGANVLFDTWVHPLMMGLEEHLVAMFRDDFEFSDAPSHLGHTKPAATEPETAQPKPSPSGRGLGEGSSTESPAPWTPEADKELKKIPFFVRGKARRNTEAYAEQRGLQTITLETLYEAKAHYGR